MRKKIGFYDVDPYFNHPYEMAAQYAGIKYAAEFLLHNENYSQENIDHLFCAYENGRFETNCSFIKPFDCSTVDTILNRFEIEFPEKLCCDRKYRHGDLDRDVITMYDSNHKIVNVFDRISKCRNGMMSDRMIVSIRNIVMGEYDILCEYPILVNRIPTVFEAFMETSCRFKPSSLDSLVTHANDMHESFGNNIGYE